MEGPELRVFIRRAAAQIELIRAQNKLASVELDINEGREPMRDPGTGGQTICEILTAQLYTNWAMEATIIGAMGEHGCDIPPKPE